jgi:hypothetical protein
MREAGHKLTSLVEHIGQPIVYRTSPPLGVRRTVDSALFGRFRGVTDICFTTY